MDKVLNMYTLKFYDKNVEVHYQSQAISNTLKPFYYVILICTLIMNIVQIILRYIQQGRISFVNTSFIAFTITNIICIYKQPKTIQFSITFANALLLLLQINFTPSTTTEQEYYGYGTVFATLQTFVYFITDFSYSCPSIILHLTFRFLVTSYFSGRFDIVLCFLSVLSAGFLISVIYICNKAQRNQYLMQIKDNTINHQLENLISKPFAKLKYIEDYLLLDINIVKFPQQFLCYNGDLCSGCNIRTYLRNCYYNGENLEKGLIQKSLPLNQLMPVIQNQKKIFIRICDFNVDKSLVIIQESITTQKEKISRMSQSLKKQLTQQFMYCQKSLINQQFLFGVVSLLMVHNRKIKAVNINKILQKLRKNYNFHDLIQIQQLQEAKITTYCYLLKIFLIQILNIISEVELENTYLEAIEFYPFDVCLTMKLMLSNVRNFLIHYNSNFSQNKPNIYCCLFHQTQIQNSHLIKIFLLFNDNFLCSIIYFYDPLLNRIVNN